MADWALLQDAYGSARDVPDLLAVVAAGRGDEQGVWDDLWGRMCHQGTVYSASYAALPSLTAIAAGWAPAGYVEPLHVAASIIASNDGPEDVAAVRRRYPAELSALRDMAEGNLALADGFVELVYALQALMAFEGVPVWRQHLHGLADEELTLDCPACGVYLYLRLIDSEFTANCDDDAVPGTQRPDCPCAAQRPRNSDAFSGPAARPDRSRREAPLHSRPGKLPHLRPQLQHRKH
jgi:hypothetical protein